MKCFGRSGRYSLLDCQVLQRFYILKRFDSSSLQWTKFQNCYWLQTWLKVPFSPTVTWRLKLRRHLPIFGLLLQMASTYTIIDFSFILVLSIGAIVAEAARRTHCNHLIRLIESACLGFESVWRNWWFWNRNLLILSFANWVLASETL